MSQTHNHFDDDIDRVDFNADQEGSQVSSTAIPSPVSHHGVLKYNNKKYAVGLVWLSGGADEESETSKQKAKILKADFTCSRDFADQSGYGYLKVGHRLGFSSMAALAADALVGEWHGVFEADNGWLYVAVHSDNIAPDGDLFFYSEQEAYNHFSNQADRFKWPKTYVPESWDIKSNDGEISLDQFVDSGVTTNLTPANLDAIFYGKTNKFLFFALCIASLIVFILYSNVQPVLNTKSNAPTPGAEVDDLGLLQIPPREVIASVVEIQNTYSQNRIINPPLVIDNCVKNIELLMMPIPGWIPTIARCTERKTTVTWDKGIGDFELLYNYTRDLPKHLIVNYENNNRFSLSIFSTYNDDEFIPVVLKPQEETYVMVTKSFNRIGDLQLSAEKQRPTVTDNKTLASLSQTAQAITLSAYPKYQLSLTTKLSLQDIKEKFNFPAVKFKMIEWNIRTGQWFYDTIVYADTNK